MCNWNNKCVTNPKNIKSNSQICVHAWQAFHLTIYTVLLTVTHGHLKKMSEISRFSSLGETWYMKLCKNIHFSSCLKNKITACLGCLSSAKFTCWWTHPAPIKSNGSCVTLAGWPSLSEMKQKEKEKKKKKQILLDATQQQSQKSNSRTLIIIPYIYRGELGQKREETMPLMRKESRH